MLAPNPDGAKNKIASFSLDIENFFLRNYRFDLFRQGLNHGLTLFEENSTKKSSVSICGKGTYSPMLLKCVFDVVSFWDSNCFPRNCGLSFYHQFAKAELFICGRLFN